MDPNRPADSPRPVRVVVNALHAHTGGGVTYLRNLLPLLADDPELELHLFVQRDQELMREIDPRVRIHRFDFRRGFLSVLIWEQLFLPRRAREIGADVVFSPANFGPFFGPASVVLLRNSLAVAERDTRFRKRLYWYALAVATAISVLRSRRAIAVSQYAAKTLTRGLPLRVREKVSIIHHGVRPPFLAAAEAIARQDFLLAVGDIYVQKNLHTLLEAMVVLRHNIPAIRLMVAGRVIDHDYYTDLLALVERAGLQPNVRFLGHVERDDLIRLYRTCRLFVFPSTVETFGQP